VKIFFRGASTAGGRGRGEFVTSWCDVTSGSRRHT